MREKYISFAQFVSFFEGDIIVNFIIQKLKTKHTSLKNIQTELDKLGCLNLYIFWGNERKYFLHISGPKQLGKHRKGKEDWWVFLDVFIDFIKLIDLISQATDYGHTKAKYLILYGPFQIPIPNKYLECGYKGLVFCRNNGWINRKHG